MTLSPLAVAHQVLGKKWVLGILLAAMQGRTRFIEFRQAQPRISDRVLAQRLSMLVADGLLARSGAGRKTRYELTGRGRDAQAAVLGCLHFGLRSTGSGATVASIHREWGTDYLAALFK